METSDQKKKNSNSDIAPFDIAQFSTLQYIKIIYVDTNQELQEISTEVQTINNDIIELYLLYSNSKERIDITCPTGVALKLVTSDALHFTKAILRDFKKANDRFIFVLDTPRKTIRQQNRKFYRINLNRPCVLLTNNENGCQTYVAESVNISKGGVLLYNLESALNNEKVNFQPSKSASFHIVLFLEHDLKIKLYAEFIRAECIEGVYRYAFHFTNMPQKYIVPFNKYMTQEEFKLLKLINEQ